MTITFVGTITRNHLAVCWLYKPKHKMTYWTDRKAFTETTIETMDYQHELG